MLKISLAATILALIGTVTMCALPQIEETIGIDIPLSGQEEGAFSVEDTCFSIIGNLSTALKNKSEVDTSSSLPEGALTYNQLESAYNQCSTDNYELNEMYVRDINAKEDEIVALQMQHTSNIETLMHAHSEEIAKLRNVISVLLSGDQEKIDFLFGKNEESSGDQPDVGGS